MDRAGGMENAHDALAAECIRVTGVSHTALDGKERRPHAPQARSLYSRTGPQGTSQVEFQVPVANRLGGTDRSTSLRSDERSTSPEFVFHIPECVFHFTEIRMRADLLPKGLLALRMGGRRDIVLARAGPAPTSDLARED